MSFFDYLKNIFIILIFLQLAPVLIKSIKKQYSQLLYPRTKVGLIKIKGILYNSDYYNKYLIKGQSDQLVSGLGFMKAGLTNGIWEKTDIVDLGVWNMDATVGVALDVSSITNHVLCLHITCWILSDSYPSIGQKYDFASDGGGYISWIGSSGYLSFTRLASGSGGLFDNILFDATDDRLDLSILNGHGQKIKMIKIECEGVNNPKTDEMPVGGRQIFTDIDCGITADAGDVVDLDVTIEYTALETDIRHMSSGRIHGPAT